MVLEIRVSSIGSEWDVFEPMRAIEVRAIDWALSSSISRLSVVVETESVSF